MNYYDKYEIFLNNQNKLLSEGVYDAGFIVRPKKRPNIDYPKNIYILLTNTKSVVGKAIIFATGAEYNHACISLDKECSMVYGFGNLKKKNYIGFIKEDLTSDYKENDAEYGLYSLGVTNEEYTKIVKQLEYFESHQKEYNFDSIGLVLSGLMIPSHKKHAFFCSGFIEYLLSSCGINLFDKDYSLVKPNDFTLHPDVKYVKKGKIKDLVKENQDIIKKNLNTTIKKQEKELLRESMHAMLMESIASNKKYGIPQEKKYPMFDAAHVLSAIKLFNWVEPKYEKQLANNILARIKEYKIKPEQIHMTEKNRFYKYYNNGMTESYVGYNFEDEFLGESAKYEAYKKRKEKALKEADTDAIRKCFKDFRDFINSSNNKAFDNIKPLGRYMLKVNKSGQIMILFAVYNGPLNKTASSKFIPALSKNVKYKDHEIKFSTCYLPGDVFIYGLVPKTLKESVQNVTIDQKQLDESNIINEDDDIILSEATVKSKRKAVENKVYSCLNGLDPTGQNAAKYKKYFDSLSDKEFDSFMKKLRDNPDMFINIEIIPYKIELDMDNIRKTAKMMNVPLFEKVVFTYPNGRKIMTPYKVPVGYVMINRLQQTAMKKNTMSITTEQRNPKYGQVTGKDKNGRSSDMENIALVTLNAKKTLAEFNGPRADDMYMKNEMLKQIKTDGSFSIDKLQSNKVNKTALNTLDAYFIAAGIKTDLVTDGLLLPRTLQNLNKDENSLASKLNNK